MLESPAPDHRGLLLSNQLPRNTTRGHDKHKSPQLTSTSCLRNVSRPAHSSFLGCTPTCISRVSQACGCSEPMQMPCLCKPQHCGGVSSPRDAIVWGQPAGITAPIPPQHSTTAGKVPSADASVSRAFNGMCINSSPLLQDTAHVPLDRLCMCPAREQVAADDEASFRPRRFVTTTDRTQYHLANSPSSVTKPTYYRYIMHALLCFHPIPSNIASLMSSNHSPTGPNANTARKTLNNHQPAHINVPGAPPTCLTNTSACVQPRRPA